MSPCKNQIVADAISAIPSGTDAIVAAAAALGLSIPSACMAGVATNLALLASHAETLLDDENTAGS